MPPTNTSTSSLATLRVCRHPSKLARRNEPTSKKLQAFSSHNSRTTSFLTKCLVLVPAHDIVRVEKLGHKAYRMELLTNADAETVHQRIAISQARTRNSTPTLHKIRSPPSDIHSVHSMSITVCTKKGATTIMSWHLWRNDCELSINCIIG